MRSMFSKAGALLDSAWSCTRFLPERTQAASRTGFSIAWTALLIALAPVVAARADEQRPNLVLIVVDDLGYGDLGCYGSTRHKTPHIDRLAAGGLRLTDFHANAPVCSPTRAALMTGQYQQRSGIEFAIPFTRDLGMPLKKTTLAEALGSAGYRCGLIGKWHLGHVSRFGPNDQGFDRSWCSNNSPDYHTHVSRVGELDWFLDHRPHRESGYLTDLVTEHTCEFIETNRQRPFFAFVSHLALHFPYQGPKDPPLRTEGKIWHDQKYGPLPKQEYPRAYREMLEEVDKSIGQILAKLEALDLRDNTLVVLTSDNGAYSWVGSNGRLRGQKGDLFEGGHRIPAIVNWPGQVKPGGVSHELMATMDIMPTLLGLAGIAPDANVRFDGTDVSLAWRGQAKLRPRRMFWRFNNMYTKRPAHAVRDGDWKYVVEGEQRYLFNLDDDLAEAHNLIGQHPQRAAELESAFAKWNGQFESNK